MVIQTLFHIDVRISGYADKSLVKKSVILKNTAAVVEDNIFRKEKSQTALVGEEDYAGEAAACGDNSQLYGVFGLQMRNGINFLIFKEREWVALIHHLGGDERAYLGIEICSEISLLLGGEGGNFNVLHAYLFKLLDGVKICLVLDGDKLFYTPVNSFELLFRSHTRFVVLLVVVNEDTVGKRAYSYHKKFV